MIVSKGFPAWEWVKLVHKINLCKGPKAMIVIWWQMSALLTLGVQRLTTIPSY